jgi:hypothetical protein
VINWDDSKKRKAFREALQQGYPSVAELAIFVDEELNENLAEVAGGENLKVNAYNLLSWADSQGRFDELYAAFKRENPHHSALQQIEQKSFVSQSHNLTQADWDKLFQHFLPHDITDIQRGFRRGFKQALGIEFQRAQPQYPPFTELSQVRELLESYDADAEGPVLAVRFVECAIMEIQRSNDSNNRDITNLQQWRDLVAAKFNVSNYVAKVDSTTTCHAYLLVALEEQGPDVIVYPELRLTGVNNPNPIEFGATPETCAIDAVANHLSRWIQQAEDILVDHESCADVEVTLEIFLPCQHLEEDIAVTWVLQDRRGDAIKLGMHRRFLIRSSDRIRDRQIQKSLGHIWRQLETCVEAGSPCSRFHSQMDCPEEKGALRAVLRDNQATGLKFLAQLPTDPDKRKNILNDIIDAAIPIALWMTAVTDVDAQALETEFDQLLNCSLIDFADLARCYRSRRQAAPVARPIKILCEHPDRQPRLPDLKNREDEDAIVA